MPIEITISVYEDHLNEGFQEKPPMASVVAQRWYTAPGIQRVNVTENGLKGGLYIPPGITEVGSDIACYSFGTILNVLNISIYEMFCFTIVKVTFACAK